MVQTLPPALSLAHGMGSANLRNDELKEQEVNLHVTRARVMKSVLIGSAANWWDRVRTHPQLQSLTAKVTSPQDAHPFQESRILQTQVYPAV